MGLCLAYQLGDRGGHGSPSCSRIRLPSEKSPFSILLTPTSRREPRQRGTGTLESECSTLNRLPNTQMGVKCMVTNLLYEAANKFRFHAPSTVTTLAYMAYRARFRMGYLPSITLISARTKNSGRHIVSARLLARGAARTLNGVLMSAAGQLGAYATRKAISLSAASIAAAYRGQ